MRKDKELRKVLDDLWGFQESDSHRCAIWAKSYEDQELIPLTENITLILNENEIYINSRNSYTLKFRLKLTNNTDAKHYYEAISHLIKLCDISYIENKKYTKKSPLKLSDLVGN